MLHAIRHSTKERGTREKKGGKEEKEGRQKKFFSALYDPLNEVAKGPQKVKEKGEKKKKKGRSFLRLMTPLFS